MQSSHSYWEKRSAGGVSGILEKTGKGKCLYLVLSVAKQLSGFISPILNSLPVGIKGIVILLLSSALSRDVLLPCKIRASHLGDAVAVEYI